MGRTRPCVGAAEMLDRDPGPDPARAAAAPTRRSSGAPGDWAVAAAGAVRRARRRHRRRRAASGWPPSVPSTLRAGGRGLTCAASRPPRRTSPRRPGSPPTRANPVADQRGPVDYKRHLADELTRARPAPRRRPGPGRGGLTCRSPSPSTATSAHPRRRAAPAARALPARRPARSPAPTGAATRPTAASCTVLARRRAGQDLHGARRDGRRPRRCARSRAWSTAAGSTRPGRASCRSTACSAASAPRA